MYFRPRWNGDSRSPAPLRGHVATWESRIQQYQAHYEEFVSRFGQEVEKVTGLMSASYGRPWTDFAPQIVDIGLILRQAAVVASRRDTLRRFLDHVESRPTPGLTDVWFANEISDLRKEAQRVSERTEAFLSRTREIRLEPQWILDLQSLMWVQGQVDGTYEELQTLYGQAISHHFDMREAGRLDSSRAERAAQAAAQVSQNLLALGMYLNQMNYQQQIINTLNRPRDMYSYWRHVDLFLIKLRK